MDDLGLTLPQTEVLISLQYHLVSYDISIESDAGRRTLKYQWLREWKQKTEQEFLKSLDKKGKTRIIDDERVLRNKIATLCGELTMTRLPLHLILLELCLFVPYYPHKKLKWSSSQPIMGWLQDRAKQLNLQPELVSRYQNSYKKSVWGLSGNTGKIVWGTLIGATAIAVTAGLAATVIAPVFATAGLAGAAAVSSGLAVLGGGAIAAGGMGMAGGIAVLVGGGAILGSVAGGTVASQLLVSSPDLVMSQAARLEVVMKDILLQTQRDVRKTQELLGQLRQKAHDMEKIAYEQKQKAAKDQNYEPQAKNAARNLIILNRAVKRSEELLLRGDDNH